MSRRVYDIIRERKAAFNTKNNTFDMFPVGCRAQVITVGQDFNFFSGNERGIITKNTGKYLGITLKFDKPRHFRDGDVQRDFNFAPDDLIRLPDGPGPQPRKKQRAAYEQIDDKGKRIALIVLQNNIGPGTEFDLAVGEVGPFTELGNIRRIR